MSTPESVLDQSVLDAVADARKRAAMSPNQLAAAGLARPFPSPEDWRDINIYFLMVDRFLNPAAAPASQSLSPPIAWDGKFGSRQGGTLKGITQQLPYIKDLGANAIWVTPVVRNLAASGLMTYHGYAAQNLLAIDERWASDGTRNTAELELAELVQNAHALGLYVILDIVLNHFGRIFWYDRGNGDITFDFEDQALLDQSQGGGVLPDILWCNGFGDHRDDFRNTLSPTQATDPDEAAYPTEFRNANLFRRRGGKTTDDLSRYPQLGFVPGDFGDMRQICVEYEASDTDPLRPLGRNPALSLLLRSYQYLVARYDFDAFRIDTVKYIHPKLIQRFGNAMTEFGVSIGKKNFFTFGEVADNNANIASFVGRNSGGDPDGGFGIDAALDFPLADKIKSVCTGLFDSREGIFALRYLFDERRGEEDQLISSHGDASSYFVTFVDNHDRYQRVRHPLSPDAEVRLCLGLLYTLPGIPCLYYGTEQDLVGTHDASGNLTLDAYESVREALWGKSSTPWPENGGTFQMLKSLIEHRQSLDALRYGRYYFRQVSGDGQQFGFSMDKGGVFAMSRILSDQEVLVVALPNPFQGWSGSVEIDPDISPVGSTWDVSFSTLGQSGTGNAFAFAQPADRRAIPVTLQSNELQILVKR